MGEWYRRRYEAFLSKEYNATEIKVFSTDSDRTLMSSASNLAGLYPPEGNQIWNKNIKWQPIPVYKADDSFFKAFEVCNKFIELRNDFLSNNSDVKSMLKENEDLLNYLTEHSGDNMSDINSVSFLWDALFVENHMDLPLPEWTLNVFPEKLQEFINIWFYGFVANGKMIRLFSGAFLNQIVEHFENIYDNKSYNLPKFLMYVAHDYNLLSIFASLDVYPEKIPPYYASTIIFELRKNANRPIVVIYYKDHEDVVTIKSNQCKSVLCNLDDFKRTVQDYRLTSAKFYQECNSAYTKET